MKCTNCGKDILDSDKFCIYCGHEIIRHHCPNCGKKVLADDKFCIYCGTELEFEESYPVDDLSDSDEYFMHDPNPGFKKEHIVISAIVVMIICACFGGYAFYKNRIKGQYTDAVASYKSGNYVSAKEIFSKIKGYQDSDDYLISCNEKIILEALRSGNVEEAENVISSLSEDEKNKIELDCQSIASSLDVLSNEKNNSDEANNKAYLEIRNILLCKGIESSFIDSKIAEYSNGPDLSFMKNISTGSIIEFGKYDQDLNPATKEDIEWIVLEKTDDKIVLISKYILCYRNLIDYHNWLNVDFKNDAFDEVQQIAIADIRLLSVDEIYEYGLYGVIAKKTPSVSGLETYEDGWWWLSDDAAGSGTYIGYGGHLHHDIDPKYSKGGIRPCLEISLTSK